jgi:hypothetical protein
MMPFLRDRPPLSGPMVACFELMRHITQMNRTQVNLVQVTPDDRRKRVWLAAAPPEDAISLVLNAVPEGWSAVLLPLRPVNGLALKMQPGDVRELSR